MKPLEEMWEEDRNLFIEDLLKSKIVDYYSYRTAWTARPCKVISWNFDEAHKYPGGKIANWFRSQNKVYDNHIVVICEFHDGKKRAVQLTDWFIYIGYDETIDKR